MGALRAADGSGRCVVTAAIWLRFLGMSPRPAPVLSLPTVSHAVTPDPGLHESTVEQAPPRVRRLVTAETRITDAVALIDAYMQTVPRPGPDADPGGLSTYAALDHIRQTLTGGA